MVSAEGAEHEQRRADVAGGAQRVHHGRVADEGRAHVRCSHPTQQPEGRACGGSTTRAAAGGDSSVKGDCVWCCHLVEEGECVAPRAASLAGGEGAVGRDGVWRQALVARVLQHRRGDRPVRWRRARTHHRVVVHEAWPQPLRPHPLEQPQRRIRLPSSLACGESRSVAVRVRRVARRRHLASGEAGAAAGRKRRAGKSAAAAARSAISPSSRSAVRHSPQREQAAMAVL
mmetsp:Transcript_4054/g.12723  ORF Transcript_4054/g.12723 Transcript_4054/m.12723 type:complete len:230 (+) Transcript_4054:548-1237(+)